MSVKIAAIYAAQPDLDYLASSLRSIYGAVERILLGVSAPGYEFVSEVLAGAPDLRAKVEIVQGNWSAPERCIADLARVLADRRIPYALVLDPQDVYPKKDLAGMLSVVEARPDAGQFQAHVRSYWKSPHYRIDPPDSVTRTVVFHVAPVGHTPPVVTIPEDIGACHNFSFASSTSVVVKRVKQMGLAGDAATQWRKNVWDAWNSNKTLRNLHPGQSARLRAAHRIPLAALPESLAGHPHLDFEVVDEVAVAQSACSVVFVAIEQDAESLAGFLLRLAATAPDDCELVGCAATDESLKVLSSVPGLRVVRVSEENTLEESWRAGSAVASSTNLVFLTTELLFEGDWIEGFIAAFERNSEPCVFVPRIAGAENSDLPGRCAAVPSSSGGVVCLPQDHQACLQDRFEQYRGRNWGEQSLLDEPFNPETAMCWASTKETLLQLNAAPVVRLDDTVAYCAETSSDADALPESRPGPPVTIVIPIFNNLHLTKNCLDSILRHTPKGTYELIVVDNGSTDGSWDYLQSLRSSYPHLRCIRNRRNLFFARGCNRGGWAASGETIVFLNNDTIVKPDWLEELVRPLDRDKAVGITGNKQVFPDSHPACAGRIWHAGMVVGDDRLPWHVCYGFDPDHPLVNSERDCQSISGCCLAIRRRLFERLGGFDPYFQNGFEDVDLCLRARELGYRIVYAPRSEIVHFVSSSESRFDREASNLEKFKARWSAKLVPDESEFLRTAGLLPEAASDPTPRVGFLSTFNQKGSLSEYAERLLEKYPQNSYVVLGDIGATGRRRNPDGPNVIRCWDRTGTWYYPVLRWATTLNLRVIHINFDPSLFPLGFLELLQALKGAGKQLVFTIHRVDEYTPLLAGIAQLADAVIVDRESLRRRLMEYGFIVRTLHVIPPLSADLYWKIYHALLNPQPASLPRIRWEGPQLVNHSLALVNREMESALIRSESVELTIAPVGPDAFAASLHSATRALPAYYGRALTGPVDVHIRHQWPPRWDPPEQGRWVVIQPWEYGGVPEEWLAAIHRYADDVWAPSTFVRDLYVESGVDPQRVHVVPNGVDAEFFRPGVNPYPLKGARAYKFLFLGGTIHRKGIDVLLDAYCLAFKAGDDVSLVIKDTGVGDVYRGQGMGQRIREMQSAGCYPHIVYLDRDLSDTEMVQLYNACDCLVHPYRGEGFALPVLEAMACARPVIVTSGGATDDFVDDTSGYRIPARKQVFGERSISGLKTAADLWLLEPDVNSLSASMIHVFTSRKSACEVGKRARAKVESGWTWKHAAEKALQRIQVLKARPILRHMKQSDAAVLIDLIDETQADTVVESLKHNSYASLSIFVRAPHSAVLQDLQRAHPDVEVLCDSDFSSALSRIRQCVRAPYFVVVTEPLRFSKNWFKQLSAVAGDRREPRIVVPWLEDIAAGVLEEPEFQRLARLRWRERRGVFTEIQESPSSCILVNEECASLSIGDGIQDARGWLSQLKNRGVRIYRSEDTCVGLRIRISVVGSFEIKRRIAPPGQEGQSVA